MSPEDFKTILETIGRYTPEILLVVIFMGYNLIHDKAWREFLRTQQTAHAASLAALTERIENLSAFIAENTKVLTAHDARAQAVWAERREGKRDRGGND